ncbi:MAG: DUF1801 domain-containing protein [Pseudomonadota bacterium]
MDEVTARIEALPAARQGDARALDALFRDVTGFTPRLWGKIFGYGRYAYTYASGHSGESLATGFLPGASRISLHIMPGYNAFPEIAARLGPHTRGKACWYIKRVSAVDEAALRDLIRAGLQDLSHQWPVSPA